MEIDFASARLQSTRINKYLMKQLRIKSSRVFISLYTDSDDKSNYELKKAACLYRGVHRGILDPRITDSDIQGTTVDDIEEIFKTIKEKSADNFIYFYESYRRKIDNDYSTEYIENALLDLKNSYYTYRKSNNPFWSLTDSQISCSEMENLYALLVERQGTNADPNKNLEEK